LGKVLTILEVSRKQDYIFASKKLRENVERFQDIADLTDGDKLQETAAGLYSRADNLVNAGGRHTVLQFDSRDAASAFARKMTLAALRDYPELELFVKTIDYDPVKSPGENLRALTAALEAKKALRKCSFRRLDLGVELLPGPKEQGRGTRERNIVPPPEGFRYFSDLNRELPNSDNFIAVIHIDGNNMGVRVDGIYEKYPDWGACRTALQELSRSIQSDFEDAFRETAEAVARWRPSGDVLPIRPIILAGDDVCFVTAGSIGLECARLFIEKLTEKTNRADHQGYSACAGVAIVHRKYPFHRAYRLAEELCENAKSYGAELDEHRQVSAMDWHIEFGQLKDSLSDLRKDYLTEDGCRLELRPVVVQAPEEVEFPPERGYGFFRKMAQAIRGSYEDKTAGAKCTDTKRIARGKVKELRTALKQGEVESRFFLQDKEISRLLYHPLEAAYSLTEWAEKLRDKGAFLSFQEGGKTVRRCLFFDSIELLDHFTPYEEVEP